MSDVVTLERKGAIAVVTVNNPPVNALGIAVREGLQQSFKAAEADPDVKAIVLVCEGMTFMAGADIKEMSEKAAADFYLEDFFSPWTSEIVKKTRKPWIAAVNGFALGGGCEIAMMADFIIASETGRFSLSSKASRIRLLCITISS